MPRHLADAMAVAAALSLVSGLGCLARPGSGAGTDPALRDLADLVDAIRASWAAPGVGVAVVRAGQVVFLRGFGQRHVELGLPVTPHTVFAIGSTTKSFTAMAAGMLADAGRLDLDRPLAAVVEGFALLDDPSTRGATARDLLCHRAGLPGHLDQLWLLARLEREDLFTRVRHLGPGSALGAEFQYSNLGYAAAGVALEAVSGSNWEAFVERRILQPLGMNRTSFGVTAGSADDDRALPYRVIDGKPLAIDIGSVSFRNLRLIGPAGSISSSLEDMANWLILNLSDGEFRGRRLISRTMLAEMHGPQVTIRNPGYRMLMQADRYGLGWALSDHRGHRVIDHGGNIEGYSSLVSMMPDAGAGVVVLSNTMNIMGYAISRSVYDRLLGLEPKDWNNELRDLFAGIESGRAAAARVPEPDPNQPASLPVGRYAGTYQHPGFGSVEVAAVNGSLVLTFESGVRARLHHIAREEFRATTDEFYLPGFDVRFAVRGEDSVESLLLSLQPGAPEFLFSRRP